MSSQSSSLRRRRSDLDDDDDNDDIAGGSARSTPSSTSSKKRPRTENNTPSESLSSSPDPDAPVSRKRTTNGTANGTTNLGSEAGDAGPGKFQRGAIVRVKLTNFVTYASAEFFPGPSLNMVIGPNGTGKSSLVCAICLGLGWPTSVLGRAGQVGEFVKHNCEYSWVEIELQGETDDPKDNPVVRVKITKDGNGREWYLNGTKTSLKTIQQLMRSLSIQIDNLCQFLPQEKVSDFAGMNSILLLEETQRAAAPEQMLVWHQELKDCRKKQKTLEGQQDQDSELLRTLQTRQVGAQAEVDKMEEIEEIRRKIVYLKKTIPFIDYKRERLLYKDLDSKKDRADRKLQALEARIAPTLESTKQKEKYQTRIGNVVRQRKNALHTAEKTADDILKEIGKLTDSVKEFEQEVDAERQTQGQRKVAFGKLQKAISADESSLEDPPREFIGSEWNVSIRQLQTDIKELEKESEDLQKVDRENTRRGAELKKEIDNADTEMAGLDSQAGQQLSRVEALSKDAAKAWRWIQDNQNEFQEEVYGPALISCSVKNERYTAAIESCLGKSDLLAFTAQNSADFTKLQNKLTAKGGMELGDITLRQITESLAELNRPPLSPNEMQQHGLQGWALDYLDGPEPVLAMLCSSSKIHACGITLADITDQQHNMLVNNRGISGWVTGKHKYQVNRRAEYGPQATSTTSKDVFRSRYWTDAPVDSSAKRDLDAKIEDLKQQLQVLRAETLPKRERIKKIVQDKKEVVATLVEKEKEKDKVQKQWGTWKALPTKIELAKKTLTAKRAEIANTQERIGDIRTKQDFAVLRKAGKVLEHKKAVEAIRTCHAELIDAMLRFNEAESDVENLKERNTDIHARLEQERNIVHEAEEAAKTSRARAKNAITIVKEILAQAKVDGDQYEFDSQKAAPDGVTVEDRQNEIAGEESKLEYMHADNPNAVRDFQKRQADIQKLEEKISTTEAKLEQLGRSIAETRGQWEPRLDRLIASISDAFAYNFEQIGCAGEVGIHKDDDFDQWAVQIKVKFRESETLQILDKHRQSGGERSVSTIFYLMALQSLARSPFRVVDEINQGMDPRNERMVHERMVDIACKENTSQYFLITPKLLTGLRYDPRMKVHCIASGEYMPADYEKLDVRKIINLRRAIMAA